MIQQALNNALDNSRRALDNAIDNALATPAVILNNTAYIRKGNIKKRHAAGWNVLNKKQPELPNGLNNALSNRGQPIAD